MQSERPDPCLFVIFGGTGDLSRRKLLPALARLAGDGRFGEGSRVLAVSPSTEHDDASFRAIAREAVQAAGVPAEAAVRLCESHLHYQSTGSGTADDYRALAARLETLEEEGGLPGHRVFYLAVPPRVFPLIVRSLSEAGLAGGPGWTRLVVEKPFGRDLQSARELNAIVHECFREEHVYRIDHYLGKDTVQNLLVLRFANMAVESLWNRDCVDSVYVTVAEGLGVGTRAGYYDKSGAVRDMVQNHLTQLLCLVAMDVPATFDADAIRHEKIKVLRAMAPIDCAQVVRGQYARGEIDGEPVPGYLDEDRVPPGSETETFVAMRMGVDTWRWKGVPFYLRTGKRLHRRLSQVVVRFKQVPVRLFRQPDARISEDLLEITLQPQEGFALHLDVKAPGEKSAFRRIPLSFSYDELFDEVPDAYETLLLDVMTGDQTLFVHADEVEESWRVYAPLLENPGRVHRYAAGTWGPAEADPLALPERELWEGRRP